MKAVAGLVIAFWIGIGALLLPLTSKSHEVTTIDAAQVLPRDAESTRALIREREGFPGADTPVAVIVYVRDGGLTAQDRMAVDADRAALAGISRDNTIGPAIPSRDGQALLLSFPITGDLTASYDAVQRIKQRLSQAPQGLRTAVTGPAGVIADAHDAFGGVETTLLLAAAVVVAVILLLTYRSPILWILPLVSVGVASQLALGVFYLLGRYAGITVTDATNGITLVLLFGAGTDYALLIIARYREELRKRENRYAAMVSAWRRSLPALLASAGTVTLGLLCLLSAQMNDVRGLGPIAAAGIAVTLAVVSTLLPALLVLLGRWVFWPFIPRFGSSTIVRRPLWTTLVGRHPRAIWTLATLLLAALSLGVLGLRSAQPADAVYTHEVGSVIGQRLLADHFPSGASTPVRIITNAAAADRVVSAVEATDGVAAVTRGSGFSFGTP